MLWTETDTAGLNQGMISSTHHPSPWPVTKTFRQSVEEQDKLIAHTSLFLSPSFQPASAASPAVLRGFACGHDHGQPACLPAAPSGQEQVSSTKWNRTLCKRCSTWITSNQAQQGFELGALTAEGLWALLSCASLPGTLNTRQDISYDKKNSD